MRKVRKVNKRHPGPLSIFTMDEKGPGGAYHSYEMQTDQNGTSWENERMCEIYFQNGPVKEAGLNGCQHEDLIAVVIDRLECFQSGDFACRENDLVLTKLQEALHWMNHRTADREKRNVEGYNKK